MSEIETFYMLHFIQYEGLWHLLNYVVNAVKGFQRCLSRT